MTWELVVLISVGLIISYAIFDRVYARMNVREIEAELGLHVKALSKRVENLELYERGDDNAVIILGAEVKKLAEDLKKLQSQANIATITRGVRS